MHTALRETVFSHSLSFVLMLFGVGLSIRPAEHLAWVEWEGPPVATRWPSGLIKVYLHVGRSEHPYTL